MARPWRDVISAQNWQDEVVNRANGSNASIGRVARLKAVFQSRCESPLAFLTCIGGKLAGYHALRKDSRDTLDERIRRLGELSELANEYLKTFKVDLAEAAKRPEGAERNKFSGRYEAGNAHDNSVDRNILSLARRAPRKAAYLRQMKAYYGRGGAGRAWRDPAELLRHVGKHQYNWDGVIGLSPGVRMEQLDFVHRGDYEADDDGTISCGAAFTQWSKAVASGAAPAPFFLWLENHPVCLEDDKWLVQTHSVGYARADKASGGRRQEGNSRNKLRLVSLTLTPVAYDLVTGEARNLVSTAEYKSEARKDPRGDATWGQGVAAFVWTEERELFIANHLLQEFHHSSFVSGRQVRCAGMIVFENGKVTALNNNSGHYKPRKEHLRNFVEMLRERNLIAADAAVEVHMGQKRCWRGKPADFLRDYATLESRANV